MKKLLLVLFGVILCSSLALGQAQKKRVAVMNFDFGSVQHWWGDANWDVGKGVSDLVVDELVKNGTYRVIERKQLDAILAEQNFSNSDRADPTTAARIGKVLGLNGIIVGSITQFGAEKKSMNLGGIGGSWGKLAGATVGTSKGIAHVAITARLIDVETAEILASATGNGESKRSGLLLGGVGASGGGFGAGGINMGSSEFRETILGEATVAAVQQLVDQIAASASKMPEVHVEIKGMVADVEGQNVILNIGKAQGVEAGQTLKIQRIVRTVKDPATGKVLREVTQDVGLVRIDQVDSGSSTGVLVSGSDAKVGDLVRN